MYGKLTAAIAVIGMVSMGMGYATFAYFSDTGTSSENLFTAGDLTIELEDISGLPGKTLIGSFGGGSDPIAPGDLFPATITIRNLGSITGPDHDVELDIRFCETDDTPGPNGGSLSDVLRLTTAGVSYDGSAIAGTSGTLLRDLAVFEALDEPQPSDLVFEVEFDPDAGNDYQGSSSTWEVTFLLRQAAATALGPCP